MTDDAGLFSFRADFAHYATEAESLLAAVQAGDESSQWRFKWQHPRFRGKPVTDVKTASLDLADAQMVIASDSAFENWADLAAFTDAIKFDGPITRFEKAVDTIIAGDATALRLMLQEFPELISVRSARRHKATLLHYIAANGVEDWRQQTPENAVEIANILLDAGAEVDALADMYDHQCTTMSMLVSSCHPANAGLQGKLAETLLDYGAAFEGPGTNWQSALLTSLTFGYLGTAKILAGRGAPINNIAAAAGLGRVEEALRMLPESNPQGRHIALALAAQHGHTDVVRLLLDAGEQPDRYNPEGYHAHSTPLHQAALANHAEVVRLLAERGARLDIRDIIHQATPAEWAIHGGHTAIADYLRDRGNPTA
jgi:hypothetical protein